jgi:hypothetical protein
MKVFKKFHLQYKIDLKKQVLPNNIIQDVQVSTQTIYFGSPS